jgi:hypothetical protein
LSTHNPSTDANTTLGGFAELAEHKVALYVADLNDTVVAALAGVTKMSRI